MDSQNLIEIRTRLGFSQQELADHLGTGLRQYQKWEAGDAPIRPMVAKAIENVVQLVEYTRLARQSKNLQAKGDLLRAALKRCLDQFVRLGASPEKIEGINLVLAQGKAPTMAELEKVFEGIQNPVEISALLKSVIAAVFDRLDHKGSEAEQIEQFKVALSELIGTDGLASFNAWATTHFVKTNTDPLISVFKALSKQRLTA